MGVSMVIDYAPYLETKQAEQAALVAAQHSELANRANLEWVLLDLLADIEAA